MFMLADVITGQGHVEIWGRGGHNRKTGAHVDKEEQTDRKTGLKKINGWKNKIKN